MSSGPLDRQIDVADAELARQRMDYAGVLNNPALSETIQGSVRSLGMKVQRGMRTQQDLVEALAEPALTLSRQDVRPFQFEPGHKEDISLDPLLSQSCRQL